MSYLWIATVTLGAVFSGNLVALLSVQKKVAALNSLQDLAEHPVFQAGISAGSAQHSLFAVSGRAPKSFLLSSSN